MAFKHCDKCTGDKEKMNLCAKLKTCFGENAKKSDASKKSGKPGMYNYDKSK
jgi:hypothetical protein